MKKCAIVLLLLAVTTIGCQNNSRPHWDVSVESHKQTNSQTAKTYQFIPWHKTDGSKISPINKNTFSFVNLTNEIERSLAQLGLVRQESGKVDLGIFISLVDKQSTHNYIEKEMSQDRFSGTATTDLSTGESSVTTFDGNSGLRGHNTPRALGVYSYAISLSAYATEAIVEHEELVQRNALPLWKTIIVCTTTEVMDRARLSEVMLESATPYIATNTGGLISVSSKIPSNKLGD